MVVHPPVPSLVPAMVESPHQTKDGLIRSLSESQSMTKKKDNEDLPLNVMDPDEDDEDFSFRYIHSVSVEERVHGNCSADHGYSKPFNWRPDHPLSKPVKTLFIPRVPREMTQSLRKFSKTEEEIDVLGVDSEKESLPRPGKYDYDSAMKFMNEPERFVSFANPGFAVTLDKKDHEWDEDSSINKEHWTPAQSRIFSKTLKILNAERLSQLANEGAPNEPVLRRLSADKTAKRFRFALSEVHWEPKLTRWLHETFCDNLPKYHIATYLEILQSLRVKVPTLVDKMTSGKLPLDISSQLAKEGLQLLIKRPWDPVVTSLGEDSIKKLPNNPLLILICKESWTLRSKRWALMLSHLGKLVVLDYSSEDSKKMTVSAYLHHMITQTIAKIRELKRNYPERPVILLGWGSVASVACQVAAMESVAVIICLGFPVYTLDGPRGEADDPIMDLKTAILFIIGQNSLLCRSDDIEDMRERMKAETGLIIVGQADDSLRVSKSKKCLEGITQSMVDRCLIDEVREFAANVLRAPPPFLLSILNDPISGSKNSQVFDSNGPPLIPASPLISGYAQFNDGSKSGKKSTPRPRKRSDKPKKPKNKVIYNIPDSPGMIGLKHSHIQSSLKVIPPSPCAASSSPFRHQGQPKINTDDLIRNHKKFEASGDKINKFIELPLTPLKPSEALKHMTSSPSINTTPPTIPATLTLNNSPQLSATITASNRHIIQHPGIRAPGFKSLQSIPHLVCPPGISTSGKLLAASSNLIVLNQHLESPKTKGPITIKKTTFSASTNTSSSHGTIGFSESLPIRVATLSPGKEEKPLCTIPVNSKSCTLSETIKLVDKYVPKIAGDTTSVTLGTPPPKDKDRRNVAEILASLSSLQPEPNKTLTTLAVTPFKSTTSCTQSSPIVSSKFVKVIQTTDSGSVASSSSKTTTVAPSHIRKQMLKDTKEDVSGSSSTLAVDEDTLSSSPKVFEQDILEEDFDDVEYKPYAKKSKPGQKIKKNST